MKKFLALLMLLPALANAQVFNQYGPANGIQKNSGSTFQNTAANAADFATLFGCTAAEIVYASVAPALTCSANLKFDGTHTVTLGDATTGVIQGGPAASSTSAGDSLTIQTQTGGATQGAGGTLNITAGNGSAAGGSANVSPGGPINITAGAGGGVTGNENGGALSITAGAGSASSSVGGSGGALNLHGGAGAGSSGARNGGAVAAAGGAGSAAGTGGAVTFNGGLGGLTGSGGAVSFFGGNGGNTSGNGGQLQLLGGDAVGGGNGGDIVLDPGECEPSVPNCTGGFHDGHIRLQDSTGNDVMFIGDANDATTPTVPGAVKIGNPTGGSQGAASINVAGGIYSNGALLNPVLTGTTGSIGGALLAAGACSTGTVAVTGATTAMVTTATPVTYPGDGNYWVSYVSAPGTVSVAVCAVVAGTPGASTYNVRVIQ